MSATAELEVQRSRTVIDAQAQIQDLFECPPGFSCQLNETLENPVTGTIDIPISITLTNDSATCGQAFRFVNTAVLPLLESRTSLRATAELTISTGTCATDPGCVRSQGYWGSSPEGRTLISVLVNPSMTLGTSSYTPSELLQILDPPQAGNALIGLAHQLIATKLNLLAGADATPIMPQITLAESLIGALRVPPVGSDSVPSSSPLGQQMDPVKTLLEAYNTGEGGVSYCEDRAPRQPRN